MATPTRTKPTPPTKEQVIDLVGDVDDATVVSIVNTGATYVEVEEAVRWASGEAMTKTEPQPQSGPAKAVYDILLSLPSFASPDDRC